jgi:hypothetical protein
MGVRDLKIEEKWTLAKRSLKRKQKKKLQLLPSKFFKMGVQDLKIEEKWTLAKHSLKESGKKNFSYYLRSSSKYKKLKEPDTTKKKEKNLKKNIKKNVSFVLKLTRSAKEPDTYKKKREIFPKLRELISTKKEKVRKIKKKL